MHLFTEETNPAGRYIRFGSVGSFRTQTGPDGIGELIRALAAATGQHSPSQIAAWENSLSDLAFLLLSLWCLWILSSIVHLYAH